jgi:hypothetical protein
MGVKLKKAINQNFAWLPPLKKLVICLCLILSGTSMQKTRQFSL